MPNTTNPPTTDALRVPVLLPDGSTGEGVLDGAALDAIAARVAGLKAPLVGYEALQAALARVGIHKGITTLQEWKRKRRLPCRKHNREVVFYLDEVLQRIGGRS
jgi:hypothetical protein